MQITHALRARIACILLDVLSGVDITYKEEVNVRISGREVKFIFQRVHPKTMTSLETEQYYNAMLERVTDGRISVKVYQFSGKVVFRIDIDFVYELLESDLELKSAYMLELLC